MGCCWLKVIVFLHLVVALSIGGLFWAVLTEKYPSVPDVPQVPTIWFGKGQPTKEDASIRPFKLRFEPKALKDLQHRIELDLTRLQEPLEDSGFTYGFSQTYLKTVGEYWLKKYDWQKNENVLNSLPQFKTSIDGIDLHFVHAKPDAQKTKGKTVIPLLIVHGWPGSFVEFVKIIPLLTEASPDRDFVFEVIAPSIPGYGFSSAPAKKGFNGQQAARVFQKLMTERLGFEHFYTQGGDWGSLITMSMAIMHPESVSGSHFNFPFVNSPSSNLKNILAAILPSGWVIDKDEEGRILPLGQKFKELLTESGYLHLQATKPDTIGAALNNSPLGLASYLIEKFSSWTKRSNRDAPDGNLMEKWTMDELLNNVMVYWMSGSITSSMRFYAENMAMGDDAMAFQVLPVQVPVGISDFPHEIQSIPTSYFKSKYPNLVRLTKMTVGGHFAAYEEPKILADDFIQFVNEVEKISKKSQPKTEL